MSDEAVFPPAVPTPHIPGILGIIANRRQQIIDEQILRLDVPRWTSPKLAIEYRPVSHSILRRGANEQEKRSRDSTDPAKQATTEIDTNADMIINACVRIIVILDDGEEIGLGPNGQFSRFDHDAAIALNIPESSTARQICRALFITEADLLRTARTLSKWSGYTLDDVAETLEGE